MNRGELWTVAGGIYASKPRPAVVIQDDLFSESSSVTVAPLTTTVTGATMFRVPVPSTATSGLDNASDVMVDKITTVRRSNIEKQIGELTAEQLIDVERAMMVFLGLAR